MKPTIFTGSGVALVTPMNEDFSINYDRLEELIEWQISEGTDAIVSCGTTGESTVMTDEEHVEVMRFVAEKVAGRVPVVAGCGSNDTAYAIWLSQEAAAMKGIDGLLHVTPYYNKTSQRGLVAHFHAIANATDLPVIVYNVPSRTGMDIKPETYLELSKHPNIVATKEANGDISSVVKTLHLCGDNLGMYSGNDDQIIPLLSVGAIGVISVIANVAPRFTAEMVRNYLYGNTQQARNMQLDCLGLCDAMFCDVNPIPVKAALNMMGREVGPCRLPLVELDDHHQAVVREQLSQRGLL